jgi:hypothetical protein
MRPIEAPVLAIAFTWLTGCSNALYFYETEKIAMSLEGRPDSSQPVQGSLGLKQRVAVVVPPEVPDTMTAKSEALSMISSFRFHKDPGEERRFDIGPVTIQTAFVTGKAAKSLEQPEAGEIARAIAQAPVIGKAISTEGEIADIILSNLDKPDRKTARQDLKDLLRARCKNMTADDRTTFEKLTGAATFTVPLCETVQERLRTTP